MNLQSLKFPVCVAHRGIKELFPENTLVSFRAALHDKAQMIEFDVALSSDRQLVVIHDETLERTTNDSGKVRDKCFSDLKRLDAGSWFNPKFKDERIPTLNDAIKLIGNCAVLNIEIKKEYYEENNPADAIEVLVLEAINQNNLRDSVMVSSFEIRFLKHLRKLDPAIALAYITLDPADPATIETCKNLDVFSWNAWHETLTQDQVDKIHDAGLKVFSFTVQKQEEFDKVMGFGVDGVFADDHPYYQPMMSND